MVNHFNGLFSHISDKKIYCILLIKMTWQMQGMCLRQLVSHFYISRSRIYLFIFIVSVWCKHMWIRFWSYSHMFLFWYLCHLQIVCWLFGEWSGSRLRTLYSSINIRSTTHQNSTFEGQRWYSTQTKIIWKSFPRNSVWSMSHMRYF